MFAEPTLCPSLRVVESSANTAEPARDISWWWVLLTGVLPSPPCSWGLAPQWCPAGWSCVSWDGSGIIPARSDGAAPAWGLELGSWQVLKGLFAKG